MKKWAWLFTLLVFLASAGCVSTDSRSRFDEGKIKRDADRGMQDLEEEEDRQGDRFGYD